MFFTKLEKEKNKGWSEGLQKRFLSLKLPFLLLHIPIVWCCGHPDRIIPEAPQEYWCSPRQHKFWFSTVNKHDVVLTVIAQTGMLLFFFFTSLFHTYTQFHMFVCGAEREEENRVLHVYFRLSLPQLFKQRTHKFFGGRFSTVNSISQNYCWCCDCDLSLPGATPASWKSTVFNYTSSSIIPWLFYSLILHAFLFCSTIRCTASGFHC